MKINWFSPLPPLATDIAHYTARTLPVLRARAEVIVWTDQAAWDFPGQEAVEIRRYQPGEMRWAELNRADMTVYHLGNNPLHGPMWEVYERHPGIVVLHDPLMRDFFLWRHHQGKEDLPSLFTEHYGQEGAEVAHGYFAGTRSLEDLLAFPLVGASLRNALGVLVHSPQAWTWVERERPVPRVLAPLPFPAPATLPAGRIRQRHAPARLVIFGYLGRNRGLTTVLQALADFPQRDRFRLDICGPIEFETEAREMIAELRLHDLVKLHGFMEPDALDEVLRESDLAINLRSPTMGEHSGSQLRIWSHALPSLVSATGWFLNIPETAAAFIRPEQAEEDLQWRLRKFLKRPERFRRMGEEGWRILRERHCPQAYVEALLKLVPLAQAYRKEHTAQALAREIGAELAPWSGPATPELMRRLALELHQLAS